MQKTIKFFTILIFLLSASSSFADSALPNNRHIAVTGKAQLQAEADLAIISLAVESIKPTSAAAKNDIDLRVNNLLAGLAQFKIDEENISASSISTEPHYSYARNSKKHLDGYLARRTLKITLNDIKNLNDLMDFALSVKINSIRNVELKSAQEELYQDQVNALAVENAQKKAASLAQAFKAQLGKIYSINVITNHIGYRYGANRSMENMAVADSMMHQPTRPGEYLQKNIVFSASINAVFDLIVQ
jgi:uncharacterized protein YggE